MGLIKINYNSCNFNEGLPVTVRFANMVGEVLTMGSAKGADKQPFKYYVWVARPKWIQHTSWPQREERKPPGRARFILLAEDVNEFGDLPPRQPHLGVFHDRRQAGELV